MFLVVFLFSGVNSYRLTGSCEPGWFYEPSLMDCLACPANASLVTSGDGFGCSCQEHSIPIGIFRCRPCNVTEVVARDGTTCVPRRCQSSAGRITCRKCPYDYISVTQNFDGSPMKEVQCVKCTRGYKAVDNKCVRCEACTCSKHEIVVKGKCIPKKYLLDRPKYTEKHLHPDELLQIVKLEYLCVQRDIRACRTLASICVRSFYTPELAGPCRLWIQPKLVNFTGFPLLTIDSTKHKTEFSLERGQDPLSIVMTIHTYNGGFKILTNKTQVLKACLPPIKIKVGEDLSRNCLHNVSELTSSDYNDIFELYLTFEENLSPLSISVRKPNGYYVKKDAWSTSNFRKFFLIKKYLSTTTNATSTDYLQTLILHVIVERDTSKFGVLRLRLRIDALYATKSPNSDVVATLLRVEHTMPNSGVLRGLEIWGGVLGSLMMLYGIVKWFGQVRRGGSHVAVVPLITSSIADALYFATLFSTLHALAAEAATLPLTLPLSQTEEQVITSLVYTSVSLKCLKVIWINWNQCRNDIFFVDWSKYNPPIEETPLQGKLNNWKTDVLAREWTYLQAKRRVSPGYNITITLLLLHLSSSWQSFAPISQGYKWVIAAIAWWFSYTTLFFVQFLLDKFVEPHSTNLIKVCTDLDLSLLVFQEELYAHYVNGRNENSLELRSITHTLTSCRIICAPQLRAVYSKLTTAGNLTENRSNREILSQFLGAFFERALDGLNWVASQRTILERLFDVEFIAREGGNTSVLLYDAGITTPSCVGMTWWGEEWTLATFDAMLFGSVLIATDQTLLAALITLIVWKTMKLIRVYCGNWNINRKINLIS